MVLGIHSDITDYIWFCRLVKRKVKIVFVLKEMRAAPCRTAQLTLTRQLLSSASIYLYVFHLPTAGEYVQLVLVSIALSVWYQV